jgi:tetratricopeptide (TPR) repeat protein
MGKRGRISRHRHPRQAQSEAATPLPAGPPPGARLGWVALGIVGFALLVRLVHLWHMSRAPFFDLAFGDGASYDAWGRELASGNWIGDRVFYQAPLYPYFLGAVYAVFGPDLFIVRVCQAALGAAACGLLAAAAARLMSYRVGVTAGLVLAVSAPAIFSDGVLQKSTLAFFLLCLVLWLVSLLVGEPRRRAVWFSTGLALGALSLARENALVFVVPVMAWLAWGQRSLGSARLPLAAMLVAGLGSALLPVATRNLVVGDGFYLTTSQFGPNLYIGNNPDADGTYRPLRYGQGDAAFEREDATLLAEEAIGRSLTPSEVSSYWTGRTLDFVTTRPGEWITLMLRKFVLLWNATEAVDTESQYSHAEWSWPLRVTELFTHFGVLTPLALLGVWASWSQRRRLWVMYLMFATYAASVLLFYVFARYRYPLLPFLIVFASAFLVDAPRLLRETPRRRLVGWVGAALALAVLANWPVLSRDAMRAVSEDAFGTALTADGRLDEALERYRRAVELDPTRASAHNNLGVALRQQGAVEEAIEHYREAVRLEPSAPSRYNLANALVPLGSLDEAAALYRAAIAERPDMIRALTNLGLVLQRQGNLAAAEQQLRQALEVAPRDLRALLSLGRLRRQQGNADDAIEQFRRAVEVAPASAEARDSLAAALQMQRSSP